MHTSIRLCWLGVVLMLGSSALAVQAAALPDFTELVDKYCGYGPAERIVEYLATYLEAGVNYFILAPVMPPDRRREHLERFASDVIPALEKMEPGKVL